MDAKKPVTGDLAVGHSKKYWATEKLYGRGDDYFRDLLAALGRARKSIDIETYIFEKGRLADRLVRALVAAQRRGLDVRLMVDGVGSPDFLRDYGEKLRAGNVRFRVYRSWPTFFSAFFIRFFTTLNRFRFYRYVGKIWQRGKHRDHRKQYLVDGRDLWIGSFNVSDWHLEAVKGDQSWRDTGLKLGGVTSPVFSLAFFSTWEDNWPRRTGRSFLRSLAQLLTQDLKGSPIRMMVNRPLRRRFRSELMDRFSGAKRRIWLVTPYFVPTGPLLKALMQAARRGCDVRLVLPGVSDVPMVRWVSMAYYPALLKAGVRLFEYQDRVLHAKDTLVDDWAMVGSSNLNNRSLRMDLEVNVILQKRASLRALESLMREDESNAREVTLEEFARRPVWEAALSALFIRFRYWL